MGSSVNAKCSCGFQATDLLIGGGMSNFRTFCSFPIFCNDCQELQVANLLAEPLECPACHSQSVTAYDDAALKQSDGGNKVVTSWNVSDRLGRILQLTDDKYLCPSCKQFTLKFEEGGLMWD